MDIKAMQCDASVAVAIGVRRQRLECNLSAEKSVWFGIVTNHKSFAGGQFLARNAETVVSAVQLQYKAGTQACQLSGDGIRLPS